MQHQDVFLPPLESSPIIDLKTWKRQKTREAARPRRPAKAYGWAYVSVQPTVWRLFYDAAKARMMIHSLRGARYAGREYNLGEGERDILIALLDWHEHPYPLKASPKAIAQLVAMAPQSAQAVLTRLGQARVVVNLGSARAQNLAVNGQFHEWNLSQLRVLRNAENMGLTARIKKTR